MFWVHELGAVSPFPFPIHMPPPSFLFLFWGHRNFLFSSQFKMACWSQWEALCVRGVGEAWSSQSKGHTQREGQGDSVVREMHAVLPTMLLLQPLTRLPRSSHGASGVSTTLGQGGWVLLQGP